MQKKKVVCFDSQAFGRKPYGGATRYFTELMRGLREFTEASPSMAPVITENHYIKKCPQGLVLSLPEFEFRGKERMRAFLNTKFSCCRIKRSQYDVFHPTNYNTYFMDILPGKPYVITILDMTREIFPSSFGPENKVVVQSKRELILDATAVITISKHTRSDVLRRYPECDPEKVKTVYLAANMQAYRKSTRLRLPSRYILYVGTRAGYKNFKPTVEALAPLFKAHPDLYLVCAGGGRFSADEAQFMQKVGMSRRVVQFDISEEVLSHIYRRAIMMIYPSLYEGFGLPILEAFESQCPAVISRASCFPEIAADGAAYFDPHDRENIFSVVERVLTDRELRSRLVRLGKLRSLDFSWRFTAEKTSRVYDYAIEATS